MILKMIVFVVITALCFNYGVNALDTETIIGGVEAEDHEFKYHVTLQRFGSYLCGGVIIDQQFVLTAAHCVIDEYNSFPILPLTVVAGTHDLNNNSYDKPQVEVIKSYVPTSFSKYDTRPVGDIAVLRLKEKLNLEDNPLLAKVDLPAATGDALTPENSYEDIVGIVSGFGWNEIKISSYKIANFTKLREQGKSNGKLLKAKSLIVSNTECQKFYTNQIHAKQICARLVEHPASEHQGVCTGDSGSPLVYDNTVIGIVSYNQFGCDDKKTPTIYTRVSAYTDFINNAKNDIVGEGMRASHQW